MKLLYWFKVIYAIFAFFTGNMFLILTVKTWDKIPYPGINLVAIAMCFIVSVFVFDNRKSHMQ